MPHLPTVLEAPISDDDIEYSIKAHKYRPTLKGISDRYGISLEAPEHKGSKEQANLWLIMISRQVYGYISEFHFGSDKFFFEWMLAHRADWREAIKDALYAQIEYGLFTGGTKLALQQGVNTEKGTFIDPNILRGQLKVADNVHQILAEYGVLYSNTPEFDTLKFAITTQNRGVTY